MNPKAIKAWAIIAPSGKLFGDFRTEVYQDQWIARAVLTWWRDQLWKEAGELVPVEIRILLPKPSRKTAKRKTPAK
jgi:hypothetical protein